MDKGAEGSVSSHRLSSSPHAPVAPQIAAQLPYKNADAVRRRFTLLEARPVRASLTVSSPESYSPQDDVRNIEGGRVPLPHYGEDRTDAEGIVRDAVRWGELCGGCAR